MKISEHIGFFEINGTPLTSRWEVANNDNRQNIVGVVKWYGPWRKYCFFPRADTTFDVDCLFTIATFCERETQLHKTS